MKTIRIALHTSMLGMRSLVQQPLAIMFFLTGKLIRFSIFFLFLRYILKETNLIEGYSLDQALLIFCTFTLVDSLAQVLFRAVYLFRPLVLSGRFDGVLTKPHHPFARILLGSVDSLDLVLLIPYAVLTAYLAYSAVGMSITIVWYFLFLVVSVLIAASFHIAILAASLLTVDVDNTIMVYRDITRLGSLPLEIYGKALRWFLTFIVPVGLMMQVPVKILFGELPWHTFITGLLIAMGMIVLSVVFWNKSLYRYQSWGG